VEVAAFNLTAKFVRSSFPNAPKPEVAQEATTLLLAVPLMTPAAFIAEATEVLSEARNTESDAIRNRAHYLLLAGYGRVLGRWADWAARPKYVGRWGVLAEELVGLIRIQTDLARGGHVARLAESYAAEVRHDFAWLRAQAEQSSEWPKGDVLLNSAVPSLRPAA
jgi:hypothetical protein